MAFLFFQRGGFLVSRCGALQSTRLLINKIGNRKLTMNNRFYSTNHSVVPAKKYANADLDKLQILTLASAMQSRAEEENKGKAGVYR